jgi:hypothetical protein
LLVAGMSRARWIWNASACWAFTLSENLLCSLGKKISFCHKIRLLKWNVVFFDRRSFSAFGRFGRFGSGRGTARGVSTGRASTFAAFGINEGKTLQDDFEFALFLVRVLVLPSVLFQAAFNQERPAFAHV